MESDVVDAPAETAGDFIFVPGGRHSGLDAEAVEIGFDAEDFIVSGAQEPGGIAGEPGEEVLSVAFVGGSAVVVAHAVGFAGTAGIEVGGVGGEQADEGVERVFIMACGEVGKNLEGNGVLIDGAVFEGAGFETRDTPDFGSLVNVWGGEEGRSEIGGEVFLNGCAYAFGLFGSGQPGEDGPGLGVEVNDAFAVFTGADGLAGSGVAVKEPGAVPGMLLEGVAQDGGAFAQDVGFVVPVDAAVEVFHQVLGMEEGHGEPGGNGVAGFADAFEGVVPVAIAGFAESELAAGVEEQFHGFPDVRFNAFVGGGVEVGDAFAEDGHIAGFLDVGQDGHGDPGA